MQGGELRYKLHGQRGRATVLLGDVIASNGLIHVIDRLLDNPPLVKGATQVKS